MVVTQNCKFRTLIRRYDFSSISSSLLFCSSFFLEFFFFFNCQIFVIISLKLFLKPIIVARLEFISTSRFEINIWAEFLVKKFVFLLIFAMFNFAKYKVLNLNSGRPSLVPRFISIGLFVNFDKGS